jgi:hypothetical protein
MSSNEFGGCDHIVDRYLARSGGGICEKRPPNFFGIALASGKVWGMLTRSARTSVLENCEGPLWVGSVSSLMQEAAVRALNAVTVSNPAHC